MEQIAPGTSHLLSFRYIPILNLDGEVEQAILHIYFKQGGEAEYYADIATPDHSPGRLEFIFLMMEKADHPGQIIWSHLVADRWPYFSL